MTGLPHHTLRNPIGPDRLLARACQWRSLENCVHEILNQGILDVWIGRQMFFSSGTAQQVPAQGVQVNVALRANHAELIAGNARVPTHIDDTVPPTCVAYQQRCRILNAYPMYSIRQESSGPCGASEKKVEQIDPMGGSIV